MRLINCGYLGRYGRSSAKSLPHSERLRLTVEGAGPLPLKVSRCRVGWQSVVVAIGGGYSTAKA